MKKLVFAVMVLCILLFNTGLKAEELDLTNFNFGTGISQQGSERSKVCLEAHYFFDVRILQRDGGIGPLVFTNMDIDSNKISGLGYGVMIGFKLTNRDNYIFNAPIGAPVKDSVTSFNIGIGWLKGDKNLIFSCSF